MGVPTLTLAGNTMIARQGASMMSAAGLADWVVHSTADYVAQALRFAQDTKHLAALRAGLRTQVQHSALMDAKRFAQHMEVALRSMWQHKAPALAKAGNIQVTLSKQASPSKQVLTHDEQLVVEVVSATRMTEEAFWRDSALGQSLQQHMAKDGCISAQVVFENRRGLSEIFNARIAQAPDNALLVFVHDDVWLEDANFTENVLAGLSQFDVIGVAGNKRRLPKQPAWAFINTNFVWDDKSTSVAKWGMGNRLMVKCLITAQCQPLVS